MFVIFDVIERDLCKLILLETIVGVVNQAFNQHPNVNESGKWYGFVMFVVK